MPSMLKLVAIALAAVFFSPPAAHADPCRAISDDGRMPRQLTVGAQFSGPVVHVIDGDSLCVAIGPGEANWVEVRLADFYAPEFTQGGAPAKAALERLALGKQATCIAGLGTYDRIAARCRIDGRPIGDLMRSAGVAEGGRAYPAPTLRSAPAARPAPAPSGLSCPELRARGGARRGEPGYRAEWDGDNDGIACEPYRKR